MTTAPLACSVRDCGAPLASEARAWICPRGHSYDIARSGYVNLLQPQDRRSAEPGDAREAVDARARLLDGGIGRHLIEEIVARARPLLSPIERPVVADLGCGTGHLLRALHERRPIIGVGLDLSSRAIDLAARRSSALQWVVANADRRLPLVDGTIDLLISIHARRNPPDAARVLKRDGHLLIAIPADDDLIELRSAVQGEGVARDRAAPMIAAHAAHFRLVAQWSVRERPTLDTDALRDLLAATYRGARRAHADRVAALTPRAVTLASELALFGR